MWIGNDGAIFLLLQSAKAPSRRFLPHVIEETQIANAGISQLPAMDSHELSWRATGDRVSKQLLH